MTQDQVIDITRQALFIIIESAAPLLLISLAVGLIVSVLQTITSIQEQTLTFVPKIIAIFFGIILFGSWMMTNITDYMTELWSNFNIYVR